jgi:hypothetical protein
MSNTIAIRKADRSKRKARVGLLGPTGSGKTLSALLIANGFGGRTCLIDTENNSADLYADHKMLDGFEYDVITLQKPYSVERYLEAMSLVEKAGYATMIIDSLSHAWSGPGGILEFVDTRTNTENKFAAWREATPKHNELVSRLVNSPCHLMITMRVKMDYVLEENDKGKKVPKKVGLQPVQRDGLEYEFDVVFDIDTKSHLATSTKDRSSIFDGTVQKITSECGSTLMAWLNKGKDLTTEASVASEGEASEDAATKAKAELDSRIADLELTFVEATTLPDLANMYEAGKKAVMSYREILGPDVVKPYLDRLAKAKDEKKATLGGSSEPSKITPKDIATLEALGKDGKLTQSEILDAAGVKNLADLPIRDYAAATDRIIKSGRAKAAAKPAGKKQGALA